jgi:hypothetical protein
MTPAILVGTHTFSSGSDGTRRQAAAVDALCRLTGVEVVNVQFAEAPHSVTGVRTLAALRSSSVAVTGRPGPIKPLMSEVFDALAAEAAARALPWFCFTNADIIFEQPAIDAIASADADAVVLARENFGGQNGGPPEMELAGVDVFAVSTAWWEAHRGLFRGYVAGEGVWDNVYTAILFCHGRCVIENRRGLVRHERHARGPMISPACAEYTRLLATLDAQYFSLWCRYWDGLGRLRRAGAPAEEETAWGRSVFVYAPGLLARVKHAARVIKARIRYARSTRRGSAAGPRSTNAA